MAFVSLVSKEPLSVFNPAILAVAFVSLVSKEPLSVFNPAILAVAFVSLVSRELLTDVNEPLISVDICADELNAPMNVPLKDGAVTLPLENREPVN